MLFAHLFRPNFKQCYLYFTLKCRKGDKIIIADLENFEMNNNYMSVWWRTD